MTKTIGMVLLGIYLILTGAIEALSLSFANMGFVTGALAIAAGIFILLGR